MPERKISDDQSYWQKGYDCRSTQHLPATMVVRSPGTYEHTCPNCGFRTIFTVPEGPTLTGGRQALDAFVKEMETNVIPELVTKRKGL